MDTDSSVVTYAFNRVLDLGGLLKARQHGVMTSFTVEISLPGKNE